MASRYVTLEDVAKKAGVSKTQVSFVVSQTNLNRVSADRQERIRRAIKQMNYRPHRAARQIQERATRNLGLLLGPAAPFAREHMEGVALIVDQVGYTASLLYLDAQADARSVRHKMPHWLEEICLDGFLIHGSVKLPPMVRQAIESMRMPVIWLNERLARDCVYVDEVMAGRLATERLLERGHRRIAFFNIAGAFEGREHHSHTDRREGYQQAMKAAGLTPRLIEQRVEYADRETFFRQQLDSPDRPTAVIELYDGVAAQIRLIAAQVGLPRPGQTDAFDILTFLPQQIGRDNPFQFELVLIPHRQLGEAAAHALLRRIARPDEPLAPVVIQPIPGWTSQ